MQLDTAGDYRENIAYDQISHALLTAESLRWLSEYDATIDHLVTQFEQSYATGFARFTELGQKVHRAEEALEIARTYLKACNSIATNPHPKY